MRYDVFNVELGGREIVEGEARLEFDNYDLKCRHLIVISKETGRIEFTAERPKDFWAENGYDWYSGH
ncbi:MAG: GNAT family N-acyltransferase [Pyrinomonadaceae bacterium]